MKYIIFKDYSGIAIVGDTVSLFLGYELGSPLGSLLDYNTDPPVGIHLIVESPPV